MTQVVDTPSATSPALVPGSSLCDSPAASDPIRLNAFQRLMRRWSQQHPYNAGQVMRSFGHRRPRAWKEAVEAVIGEVGLGRPRFQGGDQVVVFIPLDELTIEQSSLDMQAFFNEELNRPFASGELPDSPCHASQHHRIMASHRTILRPFTITGSRIPAPCAS